MKNSKKTIIYMLVFVILAALTVYVMVTQSKSFSLHSFREIISGMNPFWILMAFLGMLGFIFFEGLDISANIKNTTAATTITFIILTIVGSFHILYPLLKILQRHKLYLK